MDVCFRAALMFLLISCLQAASISKGDCIGERNVCELNDVKCNDTVMFTSPKIPVNELCLGAVPKFFMDGLKQARTQCANNETSQIKKINQALDTLRVVFEEEYNLTASSDCKLETTQTKFVNFVDDIRSFIELLNNLN